MRWGRKNGPPYPLDGSDHSASEKKAGWKKSLGGGRNESEYGRNEKKIKDNKINKINKKRAKSLEKDVQNEYEKAETEEYIKTGSKLDKLTGDDYFNEIDRIQADAFKKTFDNLVKKYGDLSTSDMDFLSKSKKGIQFMRSKRIYDEDNKRKSGSGKFNNDELDRLISESKRVASFLDNTYKEDSYKRQDAENAEWVKKQSSLEKRRKPGSTAGVSKKMGKEFESIEDKYRKERVEEYTKRSKEIFDDPELKSDLDKAKKLMDNFYNSDTYDTKLEKQYYKTVEDIGKKIVDKYMGDMSLSSNDYKKYAEYGQDKVFGILEEYDNIFKK